MPQNKISPTLAQSSLWQPWSKEQKAKLAGDGDAVLS